MAGEAGFSSIIGKLVDFTLQPIARQLSYLIHHKKNIGELGNQVDELKSLRIGVQDSIDVATRKGEVIRDDVKLWTAKVDEFCLEATKFLENDVNMNKRCYNGWCPNLITSYRLGKEAKKRTPEVTKLQQNGKFNTISNPAPPSGILSVSSGSFVTFETRKIDMMKVMGALNEANVHLIAIHGMGGVGKTTLVKEIGIKAKEDKLFDEVVMAVVSQNRDVMKMQDQIADMLGLQFTQQSVTGRASQLHDRLRNVNKMLVILDDIWVAFNVAEIGIPIGNDDRKVCKVLITTRRREVCNSPAMGMGNQVARLIPLNLLCEDDSWYLFKMNVGDVVDSDRLKKKAMNVANECRGLPIALVTVGRAMRDERDPEKWEVVVRKLRKSAPANIEGVDENVFKSLQLSYNYLQDAEAKFCFLLCSLFPEDHNILIEDLVRYVIGLRIIKDFDNVQEARSCVKFMVNKLIDSCLLLHGDKKECVKLHDVVRDVAIWIGSEKYFVRAGRNLKEWPNESLGRYTGISLMWNDIHSLPPVWKSPNLQILLLQKNCQLLCPTEFFSGLEALKVLDLTHTGVNLSKVLGINHLAGLRTLILDDMTVPADTKFLGHMKTLEVLSLKNSVLPSPPLELRELSKLRLLDMSATQHNSLIPADVMLGLSHLEELYLFDTFINEELKPAVEVVVVNSLPHLSALEISITDSRFLPQDFIFPDVENFRIKMGNDGGFFEKGLGLFGLDAHLPWWKRSVKNLLKRTSYLHLDNIRNMKNIFPYLFFDGDALNLTEHLVVWRCREFEYLINRDEEMEIAIPLHEEERHPLQLLPKLEKLTLYSLDTLKGICHGAIPSSLEIMSKLKVLTVWWCPQMSSLGFHINLLQRLQFLEILDLRVCSALQHVFEGQSGDGHVALDEGNELSLREISLRSLPSLNQICNCPGGIVHLHNLRCLKIGICRRLKNLFQSSVAQTLQKLEILEVYDCEGIEEIVVAESEEQQVTEKIVFPSLKILELKDLTNLKCFCMGCFHFEWPSLESLYVERCPNMKTFVAAAATNRTQSNPKLKNIVVDDYRTFGKEGESVDLNIVIQNHVKAEEYYSPIDSEPECEFMI